MELSSLLSSALPSKVLTQDSSDYNTSNSTYFTAFNNAIKPAFIVQPTSSQDVGSLMKALYPHLLKQKVSLAIRGTGHTPFAGAANVEGGVTIDLRGIKGVKLDKEKGEVEIGIGETWGNVYTELEKDGMTAPGGRVARVGVGGLVLGGGLSLYSTRYGFACDSITSFTLVTASGETITTTSSANSELFISLKGGLNNFGIVTGFTMKTIPVTKIWGGIAFYTPASMSQLIQATADFVEKDEDTDSHIITSANFGFGHGIVNTCCMHQTQGAEDGGISLKRFVEVEGKLDIEGYPKLKTGTLFDMCEELSMFSQDGVRASWANLTIRSDATLMSAMHAAWLATIERIKDVPGLSLSLGFFPLTKTLLASSVRSGGNAFNISPSDGPLLIVFIHPIWAEAGDDAKMHGEVERLLEEFNTMAKEKGKLHRYIFPNYGYPKSDLFAGYGEESVERMRKVAEKVDPEGVFQKCVPGGFKLGLAEKH